MTHGLQTPGRTTDPTAGGTTNRLHETRRARGLGATEVARRVGVSRQTIYAIESGEYVPNTTVALRLAHLLEVAVEDLFSIDADGSSSSSVALEAAMLPTGRSRHSAGELVRFARVGSKTVAVSSPRFPAFLSEADGVIESQLKKSVRIRSIAATLGAPNALLIAGCDPALSVLAGEIRSDGVDVISVPSSSHEALSWLRKGMVHVAGTHLRDRVTGEYNLPLAASLFGKKNVRVVTFAEWEQGLLVRSGNPKRIHSIADLARTEISIVNREKGAGARDLLDTGLAAAGIGSKSVKGYDLVLPSHLAAALAVANSQADCCVANVSAARCMGLDFIPLSKERFDLVVASSESDTRGVRALFDVLNRAKLRKKLAMFAGYGVRRTGELLM